MKYLAMILKWKPVNPESEFSNEIQTEVPKRVFILVIHSLLYPTACVRFSVSSNSRNLLQFLQFSNSYCTYTVSEKGRKHDRKQYPLPYGFRNPNRNLKSENFQDYAQKSQRNCRFLISASEGVTPPPSQ
jgi:hypothetical protein